MEDATRAASTLMRAHVSLNKCFSNGLRAFPRFLNVFSSSRVGIVCLTSLARIHRRRLGTHFDRSANYDVSRVFLSVLRVEENLLKLHDNGRKA